MLFVKFSQSTINSSFYGFRIKQDQKWHMDTLQIMTWQLLKNAHPLYDNCDQYFYITNLTGIHVNVTTQTTIKGEKERESPNWAKTNCVFCGFDHQDDVFECSNYKEQWLQCLIMSYTLQPLWCVALCSTIAFSSFSHKSHLIIKSLHVLDS